MAPTGMYGPLGYSWEIRVPQGVQYVDGADEARKAVREQAMFGADWIKYYSDHGYFYGPDGVLHSHVNFADDEARAIVDEAHPSLRLVDAIDAHARGAAPTSAGRPGVVTRAVAARAAARRAARAAARGRVLADRDVREPGVGELPQDMRADVLVL